MRRQLIDFTQANYYLEDVRDTLTAQFQYRLEEAVDRFLAEAEQEEGTEFDPEFKSLSKAALTHPAHNNPAASLKNKDAAAKLHAGAAAMAKKKGYTGMHKYHSDHETQIRGSIAKLSTG